MTHLVETGELYLWYVPRRGVGTATEAIDVGCLGMVLTPDDGSPPRLVHFPDQRLPPVMPTLPGLWQERTAHVVGVDPDARALVECLERMDGRTAHKGDQPRARLAAAARYALYTDNDRQGHLAYRLLAPEAPARVQGELGLRAQADYLVAIRQPGGGGSFEPPEVGALDARGAELQFGAVQLQPPEEVRAALGPRGELPTAADLSRQFGLTQEPWRVEPVEAGWWR